MAKSLSTQLCRKKTPDSIKENLAQSSTLYPERVKSLRLQVTKPTEALAAYYLSLYFNFWETDVLVRSLAYRAYINNYQGKWELVQEILELELTSPKEFEDYYTSKINPCEFYGNILPLAEKLEKLVDYKDLSRPRNQRRTKKINFCEYKDKGSRRLSHEYHGDPPMKPEKIDRRPYVNHPLLREKVSGKQESAQFQVLPDGTFREEVVEDVHS